MYRSVLKTIFNWIYLSSNNFCPQENSSSQDVKQNPMLTLETVLLITFFLLSQMTEEKAFRMKILQKNQNGLRHSKEFYMDRQTHMQIPQNSTHNTYTRFATSVLSGFENMQGRGIFSESGVTAPVERGVHHINLNLR